MLLTRRIRAKSDFRLYKAMPARVVILNVRRPRWTAIVACPCCATGGAIALFGLCIPPLHTRTHGSKRFQYSLQASSGPACACILCAHISLLVVWTGCGDRAALKATPAAAQQDAAYAGQFGVNSAICALSDLRGGQPMAVRRISTTCLRQFLQRTYLVLLHLSQSSCLRLVVGRQGVRMTPVCVPN